MDLICILVLGLVLCFRNDNVETEEEVILDSFDYTVMKRDTKLNPQFYDDPNAFGRIIHELGFH